MESEDKSKETAGKLIKDKAKKDVERVQSGKQPNKATPSTKLGRSKVDLNKYFGEEGYDIARDMGRVRPSKDKKDATTMPPSKEVKKTQKVNKGPSALERVKKKYKGQIMDLSKVAESFGGYIIEAPVDDKGKITPKEGKRKQKLISKMRSGQEKGAEKLAKAAGIKLSGGKEQSAAAQAFRDMKLDKDKKFSDLTPDVKIWNEICCSWKR